MTDNVTPIAPMDPPCASCGAVLRVGDRFDPTKHGNNCRQPPIRVARLELQVEQMRAVIEQIVGQANDVVTNQVDLNRRLKALEALNGSSEIPDTQRSVEPKRSVYLGAGYSLWPGDPGQAADSPELHPDSRPTEPAGAPDSGADAAARGPAGTEPGS